MNGTAERRIWGFYRAVSIADVGYGKIGAAVSTIHRRHDEQLLGQDKQGDAKPRARLTGNHAYDSWELTFERKPPRWVLDALKQRKWRWSRRKACWYKRRTRSTDPTTRTNDDALVLNFVYQFLSEEQKREFCGRSEQVA